MATLAKTFPSKQLAAQATFAKAETSAIAPDLIEANQDLVAKPLAHGEYDVRTGAPPARLGYLLSKRQVLAIANVSYPTLWSWMRQGKFPRSRVVGAKSVWLSTDIEAWLATLPFRKLKGEPSEALDNENSASVGRVGRFRRGSAS